MSFLKSLLKELNDEDTYLADDGNASSEYGGYIDTGSYILNALLSGSIYGGVPDNKVTAFAGESATGKTFFVLGIVRAFLDKNPEGAVVYYDTEAAVTKSMMTSRGIDTARVIIAEPDTIQKFKTHALKLIEAYEKQPADKRPPMMFVLDSLGLLSTSKEMEDSLEGKDVRDMTKSQVIKAAFRVLTLKLAKVKIPMLITNHVYEVVGCLDGGQWVRMSDGSCKPIADIAVGDSVDTLVGPKPVTETFKYKVNESVELTLEDGSVIMATPEHKFLVGDDWVPAEDLAIGDDIVTMRSSCTA